MGEWVQLSRAIADQRYSSAVDDLVLRTLAIMPESGENGITMTSFPLSGNRSDDERMSFIEKRYRIIAPPISLMNPCLQLSILLLSIVPLICSLANVIASEGGDGFSAQLQNITNETHRIRSKKFRTPILSTKALAIETQQVEVANEDAQPHDTRSVSASALCVLQDTSIRSNTPELDSKADTAANMKPIHQQSVRAEKEKVPPAALKAEFKLSAQTAEHQIQSNSLDPSEAQVSYQPILGHVHTDKRGEGSPVGITTHKSNRRLNEVHDEREGDDLDLDLEYSSDDSPFAQLNRGDAVFNAEVNSDSRR